VVFFVLFLFFFFKQKTAYEISRDWSSDVCSSDLSPRFFGKCFGGLQRKACPQGASTPLGPGTGPKAHGRKAPDDGPASYAAPVRSEERRVGKECRSRWTADREKRHEIDIALYER